MIILFVAEVGVMMWMLVATSLLSYGPSWTSPCFSLSQTLIFTAATFFEHFSVTGYYRNDVEACYVYATPAYDHTWVPCLAFDAILAVLSLWVAFRHSRHHSRSPGSNKSQIVDTLIQGNVIYFLRCAFSCPHRIEFDNRMQSPCHIYCVCQLWCQPRDWVACQWPFPPSTNHHICWLPSHSFCTRGGFTALHLGLATSHEYICCRRCATGRR